MRTNRLMSLLLYVTLAAGLLVAGCCVGGSVFQAKYQRSEEHAVPIDAIEEIEVDTAFGSITVTGSETGDCRIEADIVAKAPSDQEAQQIAETTQIKIERFGSTLKVFVEKPHLKNNRSVGVSFNIVLPKTVAVRCDTSYGGIDISHIDNGVEAHTSFASIKCRNVHGLVNLDTSYGSITCRNIVSEDVKAKTSFSSIMCGDVTGPVELRTSYGSINCNGLLSDKINAHSSFGSIDIECSSETSPSVKADVSTSYGGIDFKTAGSFAGRIDARTSYGKITTDLPVTVQGHVGKDRLSGTVGSGDGILKLKTSFGSIKIR